MTHQSDRNFPKQFKETDVQVQWLDKAYLLSDVKKISFDQPSG